MHPARAPPGQWESKILRWVVGCSADVEGFMYFPSVWYACWRRKTKSAVLYWDIFAAMIYNKFDRNYCSAWQANQCEPLGHRETDWLCCEPFSGAQTGLMYGTAAVKTHIFCREAGDTYICHNFLANLPMLSTFKKYPPSTQWVNVGQIMSETLDSFRNSHQKVPSRNFVKEPLGFFQKSPCNVLIMCLSHLF